MKLINLNQPDLSNINIDLLKYDISDLSNININFDDIDLLKYDISDLFLSNINTFTEELKLISEQPPPKINKKLKCKFKNCLSYSRVNGLCQKHNTNKKICTHHLCKNVTISYSLCKKHMILIGLRKLCSVSACKNWIYENNLCQKHRYMYQIQ